MASKTHFNQDLLLPLPQSLQQYSGESGKNGIRKHEIHNNLENYAYVDHIKEEVEDDEENNEYPYQELDNPLELPLSNGIKEENSDLIPEEEIKSEDFDYDNEDPYYLTENNENYEVYDFGKPYQCGICNAKFTAKTSLSTHVASIHEGIKHNCKFCGANFNHKQSLKGHISSVHEGSKPFICLLCQKTFAVGKSLR